MYRTLNPQSILDTLEALKKRIAERFPDSNLLKVATEVRVVADQAIVRTENLAKPNLILRGLQVLSVCALISAVVWVLFSVQFSTGVDNVSEFAQGIEAAINDVIFLAIGLYFLLTMDMRLKRPSALKGLHELRALAHVIDMHQLTKDPERIEDHDHDTEHSPQRTMSRFQLERYLDYCSELLALISKIAALYAQNFSDPVALAAVDEIEDLTSGISRKVWQKIMILHQDR